MLRFISSKKILDEIAKRKEDKPEYVGKKKWFMRWREFLLRRRGVLMSLENFVINNTFGIDDTDEAVQVYLSNNPYSTIEEAVKFGVSLERERVRQIVKEFQKKGERCMDQSNSDSDQGSYTFWDGFENCAENIERSLDQDFDDE